MLIIRVSVHDSFTVGQREDTAGFFERSYPSELCKRDSVVVCKLINSVIIDNLTRYTWASRAKDEADVSNNQGLSDNWSWKPV